MATPDSTPPHRTPAPQTLMGLGAFPEQDPLALQMLGMHGAVAANYAINEADLLLAFGVRFDDRVTGEAGGCGWVGGLMALGVCSDGMPLVGGGLAIERLAGHQGAGRM